MPILFPIEAENGREAALIARKLPRVKRHHKDAILDCFKTTYEEFMLQKEINSHDPYLLCTSRHQQDEIMYLIKDRLVLEENYYERGDRPKYLRRKCNLFYQSRKLDCQLKSYERDIYGNY